MSGEALLVLTTCGNEADAQAMADMLVGERLAACVNAVPRVASTYLWQGRVERDEEVLLVIKTTRARFGEIERAVKAQSSYELPEVVAVPIDAGSQDYLAWIDASVKHRGALE